MQHYANFRFGSGSVGLDGVQEIYYDVRQGPTDQDYGKPVQVFHTRGLQIIGIPHELVRILGPHALRRGNGIQTMVSAHYETEQGFYLLRIHSSARLAFPR